MKVKGWRDANLRSRGEPHTGHAQAPAPPKVLQGDSQSKSMSTLISQGLDRPERRAATLRNVAPAMRLHFCIEESDTALRHINQYRTLLQLRGSIILPDAAFTGNISAPWRL
jgi:hypothetical protein